MKHYRPAYYKDFRCIASECSDNCCIGWEIDIDEKSAAFYRSVGGDFGCRKKISATFTFTSAKVPSAKSAHSTPATTSGTVTGKKAAWDFAARPQAD